MAAAAGLLLLGTKVDGQIFFPGDEQVFQVQQVPIQVPLPPATSRGDSCLTHQNVAGTCKRLPECFFVYTQLADLLHQKPCRLSGRNQQLFGVCCPDGQNNQKESGVSSAGTLFFRPPDVPIPDLKPHNFQQAAQAALAIVDKRVELENELVAQQVVVQPNTPVKLHLDLFPVTPQTIAVGANGIKTVETSVQLVNQ